MTKEIGHFVAGGRIPGQAALIANRKALANPEVLEMARRLLEYIEAHLRAQDNLLVIANMRGDSAEASPKRYLPRPMLAACRVRPSARCRRPRWGEMVFGLGCGAK